MEAHTAQTSHLEIAKWIARWIVARDVVGEGFIILRVEVGEALAAVRVGLSHLYVMNAATLCEQLDCAEAQPTAEPVCGIDKPQPQPPNQPELTGPVSYTFPIRARFLYVSYTYI